MTKPLIISDDAATLAIEANGYHVTVTVVPIANKPLSERTATLALTEAMQKFPQMTTDGEW